MGQVIKGFDQGLLDFCVGEKRKLTIPSELAYGDEGAGVAIPPKSTLIFEIELMKIEDGELPSNASAASLSIKSMLFIILINILTNFVY